MLVKELFDILVDVEVSRLTCDFIDKNNKCNRIEARNVPKSEYYLATICKWDMYCGRLRFWI